MLKETLWIFLSMHILCEFYFQTEKMTLKMEKEFKWVIYDSVLYAGIVSFLLLIFLPGISLKYTISFILVHGILEIFKFFCKKRIVLSSSRQKIFWIEQVLHIVAIIFMVYYIGELNLSNIYRADLRSFFDSFDIHEKKVLLWGVKLMILHKPTNMLITHMLAPYKPANMLSVQILKPHKSREEYKQNEEDKNAGRFIGTLERIIIAIFISLNQYSAVGLVLTAKSIARYDRISKEQDFAEYYLLGTLLSTISAICVSVIFG